MRKSHLLYIPLAVAMASCGGASEEPTEDRADSSVAGGLEKPDEKVSGDTYEHLYGYYVGQFEATEYDRSKEPSYSNKINISIDSIRDNILYGHSVVAGNVRSFQGAVRADGVREELRATVTEPGDHKYDGSFEFTLSFSESRGGLAGTWTANDANLAVTKRSYSLQKREFSYDPHRRLPEDVTWTGLVNGEIDEEWAEEMVTEDVLTLNASNTELKAEDVENMFKGDLEIIRNSIYARHGYSFKNRRMRYVFDKYVDWYIPVSDNVAKQLTKLEYQNIELLKRYEAHADSYYDSFGR